MKLLKDLKRSFDLFRLYLEVEIDEILSNIHDFRYKKVSRNTKKSGVKCKKCNRSTKKNKKKF